MMKALRGRGGLRTVTTGVRRMTPDASSPGRHAVALCMSFISEHVHSVTVDTRVLIDPHILVDLLECVSVLHVTRPVLFSGKCFITGITLMTFFRCLSG